MNSQELKKILTGVSLVGLLAGAGLTVAPPQVQGGSG
jgi:radical SAM modification target selenobiotic family peptide